MQRLEKLGYELLACDSGPAAVELLTQDPAVDLVFSDIMMAGGMSGYDLAEWVQAQYPSIRVLLTSGFSDELVKRASHEPGELKVLQKPYSLADLSNALHDAFQGR